MPRVKIDYVISFSSEDSENPASSLLAGEVSRRKWLGDKGQASHSVVLQLAKSTKINTVTIGSHHAGLVEVLVGRSETPTEPFKVLVLSSVFMTPSESKKDEAVSKVRTFQYEQLAADTRDQSWDRIRVVCLQPYNKHIKYGLSFIHIFEPEGAPGKRRPPSPRAALPALPSSQRFQISNSSDEDDTFKPGELFAKMNNSPKLSVDAQIRQASKPSALKNTTETPARRFWTQSVTQAGKKADSGASDDQERVSRDKDSLLYKDEEGPNDKIDKIMQRDREEKEKKDRERSSDRKSKDDRKHTHNDNGHSDDRKRNIDTHSRKNDDNHNRKNDDNHNRKNDDSNNRKKDDTYNRKNNDTPSNNNHTRSDHRDRKNDDTAPGDKAVTPRHKDRERRDINSSGKTNSHERDRSRHSSKDKRKDREKNGESSRHSHKRRHSPDKDRRHPDKKLKAGPRSNSPHRLMSSVVFVLSGYQNPRRGTLRDKALAMGARYRPDWGDGCTHLICAYDNTPKLRHVRSHDDRAVIVKGDWIDDCCTERRILPWQWYATETEHRVPRPADESEPEEEKPVPSAVKVDSECDTDDEIQKAMNQHASKLKSPKREDPSSPQESKTEPKLNSSEESVSFVRDERFVGRVSISDSETDSYTDEETPPKQENVEIDSSKSLPDFFDGFTFSVDPDIEKIGLDCELLKRYVTAYSGELVEYITEDSVIDFILSVNPDCVQRKTVKFATIVSPEWVWKCHEKQRNVSSKDYIVK